MADQQNQEMSPAEVELALQQFAERLTRNFATAAANPAQPEDQLKGPTSELLERVGKALGFDVVARTEAHAGGGVRPDIGLTVDKLLTGHVELKAPGKGVRPKNFATKHDKDQFRRLSNHPNLIYTDGNHWALYREGELVGNVVTAVGDATTTGTAAYDQRAAVGLETLLRDFFGWKPIVPQSPKALARALAPLTRLLREAVALALADEDSNLSRLAGEWRAIFFPDADDAHFADAYAQTVTYALLLARVEGETDLRNNAANRLDQRHDLLAQVLRVLAQADARKEVEVPVELLERAIGAVEPDKLMKRSGKQDVWLYFYEDFLTAYDPKLRKQSGVYYTPAQVVGAQVRLVAELLRERFDFDLGFAETGVVVLDPAVGTGTYLLAALDEGAEAARAAYGDAGAAERAGTMARNFYGFELMVGAYAVAQLRLAQGVLRLGGTVPDDGLRIILTDTLESPYAAPPHIAHAPLFEKRLAEENVRARKVKLDEAVIVCLGNPPYFRQVIDPEDTDEVARQGGWVRFGDESDKTKTAGILRDFVTGTPGVHVKNLYNLYVYFWRWALWKVFESPTGKGRGIVSFITASSYLRGPGFAGMRRVMRELFDELWIIDLGGEGRGARPEENVFAIRTPVAIAIGYRTETTDLTKPAPVHYARITGTQREKFDALDAITSLDDVEWAECFDDWDGPLLPKTAGDYFAWPALTDLFPWQHSGLQFKRTWPIAPDPKTLDSRWAALTEAPDDVKPGLFRTTDARKVDASMASGAPLPPISRLAYRSLDRQFMLSDFRFSDRPRPPLWACRSARQIYLTSLVTGILGDGPAAIATHLLPDLHHFRGSYGGKHVVPLYRDTACTQPNLPNGFLGVLEATLGGALSPEDLLSYCYALLCAPSYTTRFEQELEIPGPHVPITTDIELFRSTAELGARLIWLHTYGERFAPAGEKPGKVPQGLARYTKPIPQTADGLPERHSYAPEKQELHVGDGVFAPVSPEVQAYSVSGLDVVGSWLDYRMKRGAGKKSSKLDDIRPTVWPESFTKELLELLWVIEATVALGPELDSALDEVVAGQTIPAADLPVPTEAERRAPD